MSFTLVTGRTQQMSAAPIDGFGATLRGIGVPVWSSSNPLIASVNSVGVVTGVADGIATISAAFGGIVGTSVVTVSSILTIVTDTFTRADSALTLGSAETGQAWTALSGTWGISSNQAYLATPSGTDLAVVDSGVASCTVSAVLTTVTANSHLVVRASDASNFIRILCSGGTIYLQKFVAAAGFTTIDSAVQAVANGDTLSVVMNGNVFTVKLNGATVLSNSDAFNNTATKHGLGDATTISRYDNFKVTVP